MPTYLFWLFSAVMLLGGAAVIALRNPVSSALAVVTCFVGLAGLFVGLNAYFVGIIQILVYTGAVMVLFLFIIMLLDLKVEEKRAKSLAPLLAGLVLAVAFVAQLLAVLAGTPDKTAPALDAAALAGAVSGALALAGGWLLSAPGTPPAALPPPRAVLDSLSCWLRITAVAVS